MTDINEQILKNAPPRGHVRLSPDAERAEGWAEALAATLPLLDNGDPRRGEIEDMMRELSTAILSGRAIDEMRGN